MGHTLTLEKNPSLYVTKLEQTYDYTSRLIKSCIISSWIEKRIQRCPVPNFVEIKPVVLEKKI